MNESQKPRRKARASSGRRPCAGRFGLAPAAVQSPLVGALHGSAKPVAYSILFQ